MPSREQIAAYWRGEGAARSADLADRAEDAPACFACCYRAREWKTWDRAKLERAHIVARSDGGDSDPSNFVLLCVECHEDAPMVADPAVMLAFCERREQYEWRRARETVEQLRAAGVPTEDFALVTTERLRAALAELHAGVHFGRKGARMSVATAVAASLRAVAAAKRGSAA